MRAVAAWILPGRHGTQRPVQRRGADTRLLEGLAAPASSFWHPLPTKRDLVREVRPTQVACHAGFTEPAALVRGLQLLDGGNAVKIPRTAAFLRCKLSVLAYSQRAMSMAENRFRWQFSVPVAICGTQKPVSGSVIPVWINSVRLCPSKRRARCRPTSHGNMRSCDMAAHMHGVQIARGAQEAGTEQRGTPLHSNLTVQKE